MAKIIKFPEKEPDRLISDISDVELNIMVDNVLDKYDLRPSKELDNLNYDAITRQMLKNNGINVEETPFEKKQSEREMQKLNEILNEDLNRI